MAEVLGVLGALAAASQLAEQSLKIANFISDLYFKVRDAPESIRKESLQLEQLIDIVKLIEHNPPLQTDLVESILRNCVGEAKNLQEILANISTAARDGKAKKLWRALDGVAKEKRILALFANLEREKSSLALCIKTIDS
jgi:N-terminal domain on NACHT_NTPase and P-loop NTPases